MLRIFMAMTLAGALTIGAAPAAFACGDDHQESGKPVPADAKSLTLKVAGMSCGGCANEIRNALLKLEGVYDATVSFDKGLATVQFDGAKVDLAKLSAAITKAGFTVTGTDKG